MRGNPRKLPSKGVCYLLIVLSFLDILIMLYNWFVEGYTVVGRGYRRYHSTNPTTFIISIGVGILILIYGIWCLHRHHTLEGDKDTEDKDIDLEDPTKEDLQELSNHDEGITNSDMILADIVMRESEYRNRSKHGE